MTWVLITSIVTVLHWTQPYVYFENERITAEIQNITNLKGEYH